MEMSRPATFFSFFFFSFFPTAVSLLSLFPRRLESHQCQGWHAYQYVLAPRHLPTCDTPPLALVCSLLNRLSRLSQETNVSFPTHPASEEQSLPAAHHSLLLLHPQTSKTCVRVPDGGNEGKEHETVSGPMK